MHFEYRRQTAVRLVRTAALAAALGAVLAGVVQAIHQFLNPGVA